MQTVGDLIDALGGNALVARELNLKPSTVSEMKRRGSVLPRYWRGLIQLGERLGRSGISAESILAVHVDACFGESAEDCRVHKDGGDPLCRHEISPASTTHEVVE